MSAMSARKQPRNVGRSPEKKHAKAYRRLALQATRRGDTGRAEKFTTQADYWTARAACNHDKDYAVDGAAMRVEMTGASL